MFEFNSDEYKLSLLLQKLILDRDDGNRAGKANIQTWSKHIEKLIRIDGRTPNEIEEVIKWSQEDLFWQTNILSTSKLREKFDTLMAQMNSKKLKTNTAKNPAQYAAQPKRKVLNGISGGN